MSARVEILEGFDSVDFDTVHRWLGGAYWSKGVARETVERAAYHSSLVLSAKADGKQVGYMRLVSDKTTFAWITDVFVDESARGQGVARAMVSYALAHADFVAIKRWVLATMGAEGVYAPMGFRSLPHPERWMARGTGFLECFEGAEPS